MLINVPEDGKDKLFGVWWMSTDGRVKVRWHYKWQEAYDRYVFLREKLYKDVAVYIKFRPTITKDI